MQRQRTSFAGAYARGRARRNIPLYRRTRAQAIYAANRRSLRAGYRRRRAAAAVLNQRSAGFLGIEKKFYDTALIAGDLTAPTDGTGSEFDPSTTSMISTPAQGDSEQNRDGKKILIKSVQVTGVVTCAAQADQITSQNASGSNYKSVNRVSPS